MTALPIHEVPTDLPPGATIVRPDTSRPFVAMSNRKRWSKCALSAVLPRVKTPSGPPAEEGTEAHKVAEWSLAVQCGRHECPKPIVAPPPGLDDFDYSARGIAAWQDGVTRYAHEYAQRAAGLFADCTTPTTCLVEHKVEDITIHGVRLFTIADVVLINRASRRLVVGDYKFGRGPVGMGTVDAPNEQVAGTLALMHDPSSGDFEVFGGFVYQPRTHLGEPWQVLAPLTAEWVQAERRKLENEMLAVARAAHDLGDGLMPDARPGDHCKYCPSARWCPAAASYGTKALDVEAGRAAVVDLRPEEVMALWGARSAFKAFEEDLRERVQMLAASSSPAVTTKRRTGNSMWGNPAKVAELLLLQGRADLLRPPGVEAVRESGIALELVNAHVTRAPDVMTYTASAGKDPALASSAFAKYLPAKNT